MCGIVGVSRPEDLDHLDAMAARMRYRGPDDYASYADRGLGVGLAMCRLSIVDLAGGAQPMPNEDESVWIVFNGEIYNAPELRPRLEARGHRFRTAHSDTEVLVHLYEDCGPDMLRELNGMFAFVILDRRAGVLFGARDRAGIKPFYYCRQPGRFAFASELKCLEALPGLSSAVDLEAMRHYLSLQYVPSPYCILQDVRKLPAGHCFSYDLAARKLTVQRYWRLQPRPVPGRTAAAWVEQVRAELAQAVARQALSDVPIACSLSGGLDSSAVAAILSQHQAQPVQTFTLGFTGVEGAELNELSLARAVADRWGTRHHEIIIRPDQLLADLGRMVEHLDEPYGGGLPSWYVFEQIGKQCKVALTGVGGDELFGNYAKWRVYERPSWYRALRSLRDAARTRDVREWQASIRNPRGYYFHRYLTDAAKDALLVPDCTANTEELVEALWRAAGASNPRDSVACVDFQMQLPDEFLAMTDRFSMAHSVEARVPFLDNKLIDLAFSIPAAIRTRIGDPKYLLRQAVADLLPPALLTAPKKGFVVPLTSWTRGPLRSLIADLLGPAALRQQGWFKPALWDTVIQPHLAGQRDRTAQVWTLLMLQLWHRSRPFTSMRGGRRAA